MANDLSGYRGNGDAGSGAPVDDNLDDGGTTLEQTGHAPAPESDDEPADPPQVTDPRAAMAARFAARRAAARAGAVPRSHVPSIDGDITDPDDPDYIAPAEDDEDDSHERQQQAPLGQEATPPVAKTPAGARRFSLKVDGNTFDVSREELARYAGVEDADGIPEISLVRAAQMNLAAQTRLEEAKREREASKSRATATVSGLPADEELSPPADSQTRRSAQPGADTVEMIRELQYGDPEEAAARVEQYFEQRLQQRETTRSAQSIVGEVQSHIDDFGKAYADVAADDFAADAARTLMVRRMVDELKPHGITDAEVTHLLNNPDIASRAYIGARASGRAVRPMNAILKEVGDTVRTRFGMKPQGDAPTPQPRTETPSRRDAKRQLVSQPAPSGMAPERRQPGNGTQDRRAIASARVQQMRASRFQA